jgi:hypothetical protein
VSRVLLTLTDAGALLGEHWGRDVVSCGLLEYVKRNKKG